MCYLLFAAQMGAVDRMLIESGRMRVLERPEQLAVEKRRHSPPHYEALADAVTEEILRM